MNTKKQKIMILSSCRPRDCGIATFCYDLSEAIETFSNTEVEIIAINEPGQESRKYNNKVKRALSSEDKDSYIDIADYINNSDISALSIQHEYGLYGGDHGEYLINLLDLVKKPIIITFHTILKEPSLKQKEVLYELAKRSDRVVVMAEIAIEMLDEIYNVPKEKIVMIPHGVPDLPFDSQVKSKEIIGLKDKLIISTLGLLGPGKGLEYIITAIPKVIAKYPEARYLILGPTHPLVAKNTGESYRESLVSEIEKLGLSDYVIQYKKFFNNEDIALFLGATDIYITPYENPQQITSGTLARAVSMGRSCISTSYIYAKEVLGDERGLLIPFRDSDAISEAIITLISNESMRKEMENKSYQYSRPMTWENVANRYLKLSQEITS